MIEILEPEVHKDAVIQKIRISTASKKDIAKKLHDLNNAVSTLKMAIDSIQHGYRFNDASASQKIDFLSRAIQTIDKEADLLRSLLKLP